MNLNSGSLHNQSIIKLSGAKNAATRLLAASLIADERSILLNFPTQLVDANHKKRFMEDVGAELSFDDEQEVASIHAEQLQDVVLPSYNYPIRTTYLLVGGLLKKCGVARIPYPGGCNLGNRKHDLHIMVWERLGASVEEKADYIEVRAAKLKGNEINFPISTIGGTENALICGAVAEGTTIIKNAYISPEIHNLIAYLRATGVSIDVVGNSYIKVEGCRYHRGANIRIIPDRIEAITWIIFAALSGKSILVEDVPFADMQIPLTHLQEAGIDYFANQTSVLVNESCIRNGIQPFELATGTHPGVISDMQPFYVLLGLKADGISRIYDYRYPERTAYLEELSKFIDGGLSWSHGRIETTGVARFHAAEANSTDLRGSMAVLIASLLATDEQPSRIDNIKMAMRGYNKLEEKLQILGYTFETKDSAMYV